jgi:hypothetical protein
MQHIEPNWIKSMNKISYAEVDMRRK